MASKYTMIKYCPIPMVGDTKIITTFITSKPIDNRNYTQQQIIAQNLKNCVLYKTLCT